MNPTRHRMLSERPRPARVTEPTLCFCHAHARAGTVSPAPRAAGPDQLKGPL